VDPIFLPCLQVYTYVLNDQPAQLQQMVGNGIIPDTLKSIERRVPLHPDFLIIVMKFMATMHLNEETKNVLV